MGNIIITMPTENADFNNILCHDILLYPYRMPFFNFKATTSCAVLRITFLLRNSTCSSQRHLLFFFKDWFLCLMQTFLLTFLFIISVWKYLRIDVWEKCNNCISILVYYYPRRPNALTNIACEHAIFSRALLSAVFWLFFPLFAWIINTPHGSLHLLIAAATVIWHRRLPGLTFSLKMGRTFLFLILLNLFSISRVRQMHRHNP